MSPLWSYALSIIGLVGLWLTGRDKSIGWAIGFWSQILWVVYAVTSDQFGFIVSSVAYAWVSWRYWRLWKSEGR